ncbi:hypothetical protein PanWU01x14_083160, partial [Parasponia andersonii]
VKQSGKCELELRRLRPPFSIGAPAEISIFDWEVQNENRNYVDEDHSLLPTESRDVLVMAIRSMLHRRKFLMRHIKKMVLHYFEYMALDLVICKQSKLYYL